MNFDFKLKLKSPKSTFFTKKPRTKVHNVTVSIRDIFFILPNISSTG